MTPSLKLGAPKSEGQVHQAQIGQHLFRMHRRVALGRFQFDHQSILNQKIDSEGLVEQSTAKHDGNDLLAFDAQSAFAQKLGKQNFIDRFEQTRPDFAMQLIAAVQGQTGQFFNIRRQTGPLCGFVALCES